MVESNHVGDINSITGESLLVLYTIFISEGKYCTPLHPLTDGDSLLVTVQIKSLHTYVHIYIRHKYIGAFS